MAEDLVLYGTDDTVGLVTLNRPTKLNALNMDMRAALSAALRRADEDAATSVVVLRGAGRSFCVGYDLSASAPASTASGAEKGAGNETWRHDALRYHGRLDASL